MFNLTNQDIDDIMVSALEGGINYWCSKAEVDGNYLGEYASEQISRGGSLILYDIEEAEKYSLTKDKFIKGFEKWVLDLQDIYGAVSLDGNVDTGMIDACAADSIIQFAIFGELRYA